MIEFEETIKYRKPDVKKSIHRLLKINAALTMETARYVQNVTRILTENPERENRPLKHKEEDRASVES